MSNAKKVISLLFVIIVVVLFFKYQKVEQPQTQEDKEKAYVVKLLDSDRRVLKNPSEFKDVEVTSAALRLGYHKDLEARNWAFLNYQNPDLVKRETAIRALGFFSDSESEIVLKEALNDSEEAIRVAVLEIFASYKDHKKEQFFLEKLSQNIESLGLWEKLAVYEGAFLQIKDEDKKDEIVSKLIEAFSISAGEYDLVIIRKLIQLAPKSKKVQSLLGKQLEKTQDPQLIAVLLRFIAQEKIQTSRKVVDTYISHPDMFVRQAVGKVIVSLCFNDTITLYKKIINLTKESATLLSFARNGYELGGSDGKVIVDEVLKNIDVLNEKAISELKEMRILMDKINKQSSCNKN